jgi:ribulose-5-phosphate 4-epimerase/fuculose-1-phosphate aldolase
MENLRKQLATAFQICAIKGWDNWTYTHISARLPGSSVFLINPFELLYQAVTPKNLIAVDMTKPLGDYFKIVNPTGLHLHSAIYKKRPDINAIFHLHTANGVAVSTMKCGLLPISQYALHFYKSIATHRYDSLVLDETQQAEKLANDLGKYFAMILENHGTLTTGQTLEEAFFFTHHLEEACKVQCLASRPLDELILLNDDICKTAHADLMNFEKSRGMRDWKAAKALLPEALKKSFDL